MSAVSSARDAAPKRAGAPGIASATPALSPRSGVFVTNLECEDDAEGGAEGFAPPLDDATRRISTAHSYDAGEALSQRRAPEPPTLGSVGTRLLEERKSRGFTLEEVSRGTRIPVPSLHRLETDRFDDLPGEVFVRGFLKSYARFLGLEPDAVLAHYGAVRRVPDVAPMSLPTPPARREVRQVGIAVAVMVLVVVCTMALSFVLKPRGRDVPAEVSSTDAPAHDLRA